MSIETVANVTWNNTVDVTNKIGISDTLDNLSVDVWSDDSVFVTAYNNPTAKFERLTDGYPTTTAQTTACPWYLSGFTGYSNTRNNSSSVYQRSVLLACTEAFLSNYSVWNGSTGSMIRNTNSELRIITSLDLSKNGIDVALSVDSVTGAVTYNNYTVQETVEGATNVNNFDYDGVTYRIVCADIFEKEGNYFVVINPVYMGCMYDRANGDGVMGSWAYSAVANKMYSISPQIFTEDDKVISINGSGYYNINTWIRHLLPDIPEDENLKLFADYTHDPWHITITGNVHYHLLSVSRFGMYFTYNNTKYKPLITQGVVTGYTTDMSVQSDIDNWTNISGHNINPTPPPPAPSGDDAEDEIFGWGGNEVAGMVRYYLLSQAEMESLQAYMSNPNWRMDYRNCVIGMYVVPNGGLFFDAPVVTTLKFRIGLNETGGVIPQDQELDTGISCLRISGVVNNESAVIELPRMNGNFLDFEPYSKYMVYVPFCGVIPLPDYVAGKEIKITIYPDVPTCTCTAVVTSEGRKIATAKGAFGSQLPLTSDGDGLKAASVINSLGNIIMGAGEVALGIGTGMVPLAIAGGAQMLGSGLQADLQLGQSFGYSIGSSGDTSFFGAGSRCEYYVAYSKWNNPDSENTNIYGHTYGFVCNKRGLLKDFEGFTMCDNPHVYGFSCTSDEKDEIERLLREGIIIHIHEE